MISNTGSSLLYIGIMSGTSADGIDLALVDFSAGTPELKAAYYQPYNVQTRELITSLYVSGNNEVDAAFNLDVQLAKQFASAVNAFLKQESLTPEDISAIGNHGQTIRHRPIPSASNSECFTVQIGCNQTLAVLTGIRVVGQFRQKDIALGGQGAPLVPAFHRVLFNADQQDVFVVNIGGIANISYLPCSKKSRTLGFDTGPGNALLDDWFQLHHPKQSNQFDLDGDWAKSGTKYPALFNALMADNYFLLSAPKSTGREYFNLPWLNKKLLDITNTVSAADIQATLAHLTVESISNAINCISPSAKIYICGGGLQNLFLLDLLKHRLQNYEVVATNSIGIDSDSLEAMAFAWLAYAYDNNINSNMPAVTGASKETVLGVSYSY